MDSKTVPREKLGLKEDEKLLSPPWLAAPLYQCATAVTVYGFVAHAGIDVEVAGSVVISATVGFPQPQGATLDLPAALVKGQKVRVRQRSGGKTSKWSTSLVVRDHTKDYPAGPPRPHVAPTPLHECGCRTGVGNLLAGGNVWVTADGAEVGRVDGCAPSQGIDVSPDFDLGQEVRGRFELCGDRSPWSKRHTTQTPPDPLPTPQFDPVYAGGEQIRITDIANGARVTVYRDSVNQGTWGCWGGSLLLDLGSPFTAGETLEATQRLCAGEPSSPTGTGGVEPCSDLPAPMVGPVQAGDTEIVVTDCAPGALITVFVNGIQAGAGAAPVVHLDQTLELGDTVHVTQDLPGCHGQLALEVVVACVDPPIGSDPSSLDLFPVGSTGYSDGGTKGIVYYPADDDGDDQPFNERLAKTGRVPIVVMAHGNHDPVDPSYLGYTYFQATLARMGIIAVSVDCNAANNGDDGLSNIEDRVDLIVDSIKFFQARDTNPDSRFFERIDFGRVGLMGHSRGGDAMVQLPAVASIPGVTIKTVLALAPTNFRFWNGLSTTKPEGYAFMTILPAGDGDVRENNGAQFYDQAEPAPFRSQVYVHYTNHNFFNREWLDDESAGPAVVGRGEHERILKVYGSALFRSQLLGHSTHGFLAGDEKPSGVKAADVFLSFEWEKQVTVDDHEDGNTVDKNSLDLATSQSGGMNADEFPMAQTNAAFNDSFFGESIGLVARSGGKGRIFRSAIGKRDLRKHQVWVRAAEIWEDSLPADATGFRLGLEDAKGTIGWVDSDQVGGLPRPYDRDGYTKSMLNTLRFKASCFKTAEPRLDLGTVRAILIGCNRKDKRPLAFDDLQIVKPKAGKG